MVERNKQTYIYKQINKTDRKNKQQSINIAGIDLNGKIIKLNLIGNRTYSFIIIFFNKKLTNATNYNIRE